MRTTLSLDEDLALQLRRVQAETGRTWKQVVNDVMRAGLGSYGTRQQRPARIRRTKGVRLGAPMVGDISNIHEVLSLTEGEDRL